MSFGFSIKSIGGLYTGHFPSCGTLAQVPATNEPQASNNDMPLWQPYFFKSQGVQSEWEQYIKNAIRQDMEFEQLAAYLRSGGYTSENTACTIAEFAFVDDAGEIIESQTLCLRAFNSRNDDTLISVFMAKKNIVSASVTTYTTVSTVRGSGYDRGIAFGVACGRFVRGGKTWYCFGFFTMTLYGSQFSGEVFVNDVNGIKTLFGYDIPTDNFSPQYGYGSTPAGYAQGGTGGSFDDSSDIIALDNKPQVGVTTAGFINVYKISQGQLNTLGEKLFPHFLPAEILADPSQMSTPEMLAVIVKMFYGAIICPVGAVVELADNLGIIDIIMNGKLIDYIIDCHIIPCSISGATVEGLRVGYRQFNDLQLAKATEDYVDIDLGSLTIPEYWANFLDYANGVACELFLPFVGFVPIDPEYWNGGEISIVYRFNIVDGSFQAKVFATSSKSQLTASLIGQYGGVACVHLPISGLQYANVIAGLVNGSAATAASAAGGNIGGAVSNIANMAMLRPDAPMSNGYNASSSFLSHRTPYLIIKRATAQFSERYPQEMGLPLNVQEKLSNVHGFTVIDNPRLNIACSDREYDELVTLLKSGIIL